MFSIFTIATIAIRKTISTTIFGRAEELSDEDRGVREKGGRRTTEAQRARRREGTEKRGKGEWGVWRGECTASGWLVGSGGARLSWLTMRRKTSEWHYFKAAVKTYADGELPNYLIHSRTLMRTNQLCAFFGLLLTVHMNAAYAAPINPQSILVSNVDGNGRGEILEFSRAGVVLQKFLVPTGAGSLNNINIGDIAMARNGKLQIFNGRFEPYLTTLTPQAASGAATFEHHTMAGWSHTGHTGIAIDEGRNAIYVNDMSTVPPGSPSGIIEFDANSFTATRRITGGYTGVTLGQDGLLYASYPPTNPGNHMLDVIDPNSFSILRTVELPRSHVPSGPRVTFTGYAVDAQGNIYGAEGADNGLGISKFTPDGIRVKFLEVNITFPWLHDLALSENGELVTLSQHGDVIVTTTELNSYTSFRYESIRPQTSYVAWAVVPEPSGIVLLMLAAVLSLGGRRW